MLADLPGPRGLPIVGSLIPFARDPLGYCSHLQQEYGDLVRLRLGEHTLVLVAHPDGIADVVKQKPLVMHKDALYVLLRPLLGNGLVTAEGETWKRHRSLAAPSFSRRQVDGYAQTMASCGREFAETLRHGQERDLSHDMMEVAQSIALKTLFGGDLDLDVSSVAPAIATAMEAFVYEAQGRGRALPNFLPTRTRRRAEAAIAELDAVIYRAIEARRAAGLGDDLLSRLIAATDDEGKGFDDLQLRDEAVTLFLAGHETTALALTYTLLHLGHHPEALAWVLEEVDATPGELSAASLRELPRTEAAVKESMRLIPPVWAIGREAQQEVEIGGCPIPSGTQLLVTPWVTHRDSRWFPDPESYKPSRWTDGSTDDLPRYAYVPFGGGPRVCIGNHFAMLEAVLVLVELLRRVTLKPLGPLPPGMMASITVRPTEPVPVRVERR